MDSHELKRLVPIEGLPGHRLSVSEADHVVVIDNTTRVLSPGQYRVLLPLVRSPNQLVPFSHLVEEGVDPDDPFVRHSLGRTISRLRARLWPFGLDIRCTIGKGYILTSLDNTDSG